MWASDSEPGLEHLCLVQHDEGFVANGTIIGLRLRAHKVG
jgi:hypothetical protein